MFAVLRDRAICRMVKGWRDSETTPPTQFNGRNRGEYVADLDMPDGARAIGHRNASGANPASAWRMRLHRTISPATPPHSAGTADKAFNRQYIRSTHAARAATPSVSALMNYLPR